LLNGFEGVALDAEAAAAITGALEACAARARVAEAAYDEGGEAAADAAEDDPQESFFHSEEHRGDWLPAGQIETFEPFIAGEPHWYLAGAERPAALIAFEEAQQERKRGGQMEAEPPRE
jgi:hypothetical protein